MKMFSSVTQSCPTLCDPMGCSMPGFPGLHYLLEFAQIHVHWVSDSIQPSHPLLPLPSIFPRFSVFSNESALQIRWWKDWSFSFSISPSNEKNIESGKRTARKALLEFYKAHYHINVSEKFCRKETCWTLSSSPILISTTEFFFEGTAIQLV